MLSDSIQPFEQVLRCREERADYRRIGHSVFIRALFDMHFVRFFETAMLERAARGEVTGPVHTAIGQEVVAAAVLRHLRPDDLVVGNHRSHHHLLVQSLTRLLPADWDPLADAFPDPVAKHLAASFAEVTAQTSGVNHGAGGSMHLRDAEVGFAGSSAIVGGGIPLAAGLALAHRRRASGGVAVCFIGDGAVNQGVFHESANLARLLALPLLIVVENNGYAESTRPDEASSVLPLAGQGAAHGLRAVQVAGDEPAALTEAAGQLLETVRAGRPALLEVETYRHLDHVGPRRGSAAGYRDEAEEQRWLERDPLVSLPRTLRREGLLPDGADLLVAAAAERAVGAVWERVAAAAPPGVERLDPYRLLRGAPPAATAAAAAPAPSGPTVPLTFQEAIAEGLGRALHRDPDVLFLGEEVGKPGGLLAQCGRLDRTLVGTRIIDTPISEAGFVGLAGGAALAGLRPVVELMYGSFALVAADQLFNHIGVVRALYGNTAKAPVVVRTKVPTGLGYGPQHGLNPVGLFGAFPGWRVHAPADAREYLGVLNSALECDDPVLIVEFSPLYGERAALTEADFTARLPLEGARTVRAGSDVTLVGYGLALHWALEAAEVLAAEGVDAEVVDLRALDFAAIDWSTLEASLRRTGRGLFVDPAARGQAIGPRLVAELGARSPGPVLATLACADVQPVARELERQAVLTAADVVRAARRLIDNHTGEAHQ